MSAAGGAAVALAWRSGFRGRTLTTGGDAIWAVRTGPESTSAAGDTTALAGPSLDERSRSALAACMYADEPADHLCWTTMVTDPALHDTAGHIRLVGHYETEFAAIDASAQLADALNQCLIPGEAPLTATAFGIELSDEPISHTGVPIAYSGTPLSDVSDHGELTNRDGSAFRGSTWPGNVAST